MLKHSFRFYVVLAMAVVLGICAVGCDQFMTSAMLYIRQDPPQYGKAIEQLKEGLTVVPENGNYYRLLAHCYFQVEQYKESRSAFDNAIKFLPDKKDSVIVERDAKYDSLYNRSVTFANRAATAAADSAPAYFEKAHKALDNLFAFMPDRDGNYMLQAFLSQKQGKPDEAKKAYLKAVEINPKNTDAYSNLGVNSYTAGNYDEAIGYYRKIIAVKPADTITYTRLGMSYFAQGKYSEAVEPFRMAVTLDPTNRINLLSLATAIVNENKNVATVFDPLEKALKLQEDDETWKLMGVAAMRESVKDYDRAILAFKKITELKPESREYWNYLREAYALKGMKAEVKLIDKKLKDMK